MTEYSPEHLLALLRAVGVDSDADPALVAAHRQAATTQFDSLRGLVRSLVAEVHAICELIDAEDRPASDISRALRSACAGAELSLVHNARSEASSV